MITFRSHILSSVYIALFIIMGTNSSVIAQQDSSIKDSSLYWINLGFGGSSFEFATGFSFSHQTQREHGLLSIRFIHNEKLSLFSSPAETLWDFGILYGIMNKGTYGMVSISGGGSIVGGVRKGELLEGEWFSSKYTRKNFTSVGIPLESQLMLTPSPFFGIGLYGFANLNPEQSYFGILLNLQIGKLRKK